MTTLSHSEKEAIMKDMKSFDESMPAVGIFWYDSQEHDFFGAAGVIFGPLAGAIIGELLQSARHGAITDKALHAALKAGWGSFIGILFGTIIKLIACGLMTVALIQAL